MSNNWKAMCSDETQQIVYACSYEGGIYKSIDGGQSFITIYEDTDKKYLNISCDKTGDYFVCGCDKSVIICSLDGGAKIKERELSLTTLYNVNEVHTNPDAKTVDNNVAIFICAAKAGKKMLYIYNDLSYFSIDLNYNIGSMCMTSSYITILGSTNSTFNTYAYPQTKDAGITTSISSLSGLSYLDGKYLICNETYACCCGNVDDGSNELNIWVMEITNLSNVFKILTSTQNQCLTISKSSCVYENKVDNSQITNFNIYKYFDFVNESYTTENIYSSTESSVMSVIYTNPYNVVNSDVQPLLIANNGGDIYYSEYTGEFNTLNFIESFISCFLENTKIKILKNNEPFDELIQNLKIDDNVIISNGETRKLKFIGYNFIHVNNIKNIAKIKKDVLGLNKPCEDLYVMTGHSLLFKEIPDDIKNEHYDGTIYDTKVYDDYDKIITLHTNIYETPTLNELNVIDDKIKYFHIALENENKDEHYAIYSNNILTETMTLNYVKKSNLKPL